MLNLKKRMKAGEHIMGTMVSFCDNPDLPKVLKIMGFDYMIIDNEHGCMDFQTTNTLIAVSRAIGFPVMVRIPELRRELCLKYLEMGADGFLLPNVETAEQAKKLVEYSLYAPQGNKGVGLGRGNTQYQPVSDMRAAMKEINDRIFLMIQIESPVGVSNVDEIMAVEGIDSAMIGPNDLSQTYGIIGEYENPIYIEAVDRVIDAAKRAGKHSGTHLQIPELLKPWMDKGMTMNMCGTDLNIFRYGGNQMMKILRQYY